MEGAELMAAGEERFFDSHLHLQDPCYQGQTGAVISRALSTQVCYMSCCATCPQDWHEVLALAQANRCIVPSLGVHPWFIHTVAHPTDGWFAQLSDECENNRCGIGEIGLDFTDPAADRQVQEDIFTRQLRLAQQLAVPVTIHCRKAWLRLVTILKQEHFSGPGIMHAYSGPVELVKQFEDRGLLISFCGAVTNDGNKKIRRVATAVSQDCFVLETDSPALIPYSLQNRGELAFNEPAFIPLIAHALAGIKECSLSTLTETAFRNAMRLFKPIICFQ
ncbi:MAG: TatD family hydrolase [Chitinivibrionales bacterium]|nr:TatD family hydrolase [Chitinivibrionales bacterium]